MKHSLPAGSRGSWGEARPLLYRTPGEADMRMRAGSKALRSSGNLAITTPLTRRSCWTRRPPRRARDERRAAKPPRGLRRAIALLSSCAVLGWIAHATPARGQTAAPHEMRPEHDLRNYGVVFSLPGMDKVR